MTAHLASAPAAQALLAFIASIVFTALSIPIAIRLNIFDLPAALKIHSERIPRLGGLGIFAGMGAIWFSPGYLFFTIGAALMFIVGVIDDRWNISPRQKLMGQAVAATALWYAVAYAQPGLQGLMYGFLGCLFAVILSNAVNLIDGMNGLAGGNAFLIFAALNVLAMLHGIPSNVTLVAAAAALGFLPFNFPRARVFMGDSGSLLIGYILAYAFVRLMEKDVHLLAIGVMISIVPIFDLVLGVMRRALAHKPIFSGDRGHFYDRINQLVDNSTKTVIITYAITAMVSTLAIWSSLNGPLAVVIVFLGTCAALAGASLSMGWLKPAESR